MSSVNDSDDDEVLVNGIGDALRLTGLEAIWND